MSGNASCVATKFNQKGEKIMYRYTLAFILLIFTVNQNVSAERVRGYYKNNALWDKLDETFARVPVSRRKMQ